MSALLHPAPMNMRRAVTVLMTIASAMLTGCPMNANTIQTSAAPTIHPAMCTTLLAMKLQRAA